MNEPTFIFFAYMLAILVIFGICAVCVECYIKYKERKNHLRIMQDVIKLESLQIKGK
jgi:heme/copper-type cytochrome/quinol oxidase subunit 2